MAQNGAIGWRGALLYHLRADLRRFKALTTGHTVVMGRNTFLSLPKGALPNRRNVVLSRRAGAAFEGCDTYGSLEEALASCREDERVFVIGGAQLYEHALPLATHLSLTEIDATPEEADAYFPPIDTERWREVSREHHEADEQNEEPFDFVEYELRG